MEHTSLGISLAQRSTIYMLFIISRDLMRWLYRFTATAAATHAHSYARMQFIQSEFLCNLLPKWNGKIREWNAHQKLFEINWTGFIFRKVSVSNQKLINRKASITRLQRYLWNHRCFAPFTLYNFPFGKLFGVHCTQRIEKCGHGMLNVIQI